MPSTFTWLDYSESDRRKVLDTLRVFEDKETRDELGIGSVRDAFADMFFPGTSTIQTRARYFLFIPWMYRQLEERRVPSTSVAREARRFEISLIGGLLAGGEAGMGVIGERARATLQRLPSSVYWQGLAAWGIRLFTGSIDQYHRSLDRFYAQGHGRRSSRAVGDDPIDEYALPSWHPRLPPAPPDFPSRVTFALTPAEAEYLAERIKISVPKSLLTYLVDASYDAPVLPFVWAHPALAAFPAVFQEQVTHARNFSEAIHGAALLYNLMLAELAQSDDLIEDYRSRLDRWAAQIHARNTELTAWNGLRFWEIVHLAGASVPVPTRRFIDTWLEHVCTPGAPAAVADNQRLRTLISERELQLKRKLARLHSLEARKNWNGSAGTGQLDYRWSRAQTMLADLQASLMTR